MSENIELTEQVRVRMTRTSPGTKAGTVITVDAATADRLVRNGNASRNVPADPEAVDAPTTVKDILAEVGDDAEKAAAYLEAEQAGDKRPNLVKGLQAVIDAAAAGS